MSAERLRTSIYLLPSQLDRLRTIADARNVSLSQVAREAIDLAFVRWDAGADLSNESESESDQLSDQRLIARAPVHWPREFRRQAAREGQSCS